MEIRKTSKRVQIVKGKPIPQDIFDDTGELLIAKGTVIDNLDDPDLMDMDIDVVEKYTVKKENEVEIKYSPFELISRLQLRLKDLYANIDKLEDLKSKILEFCRVIQNICYEDTDASLSIIMIDDFKQYSVRQAIKVAIICDVISRHLGWTNEDRTILVSAALTMNISIAQLQDKLHNYSQKLDESQKSAIKNHPENSVKILRQKDVNTKLWLDTILQHHEDPKGTGYPKGLKGNEIIPSARLLSLADVYCARVTGREYRTGLKPNSAMREIFLSGNQGVEEDLAMIFIKVLGIFPPGTFVKLANHETAIVSHRGDTVNSPFAYSIVKPDGNRIFNPTQRDCSIKEYSIINIISKKDANIDINRHQIWGYGAYNRPKFRGKNKVKPFRKKRRINIHIPAKLLDIDTATVFDCILLDISETGCLVKTSIKVGKDLKVNANYLIFFKAVTKLVEDLPCIVRSNKINNEERLLGIEFKPELLNEIELLKYIVDKITGSVI